MSELPEKNSLPLRELVNVIREKVDPSDHPDLPFIGLENIEAHTTRILGIAPSSTVRSKCVHVMPGDVLYSRLRPYLNKVTTCEEEALVSAEIIPLTPTEKVVSGFIKYRLNSHDFVRFASSLNTGDRPRVDFDQISEFRISIPDTETQDRIVETLDSNLTRIAKSVELLDSAALKVERLKRSVLRIAVEGRLVPTDAELARKENRSYEPADKLLKKILVERKRKWIEDTAEKACERAKARAIKEKKIWTDEDDKKTLERELAKAEKKYKEPAPPDTAELPDLPEGWIWTSFAQLIVWGPQNGLYVPAKYYGGGVPILRIDDFQLNWSRKSECLQKINIEDHVKVKYRLRTGDLIVNRVNSLSHLGKCLVIGERNIPSVFESNMMRLRCSNLILLGFLEIYLKSVEGRQRLTQNAKWAVNQASINQTDVSRTPVPLPPSVEQARIVAKVDSLLSVSFSNEQILSQVHSRLISLRNSILSSVFRGGLTERAS